MMPRPPPARKRSCYQRPTMKTLQQSPAPGGPVEATGSAAGEQKQMADAREVLKAILSSVMFLSGQGPGTSITGESEEYGDDLSPFLEMRAADIPELRSWLKRKDREWVYPDIRNEMTEMMAADVLSVLLEEVRSAEHFSVIMEEVDYPGWARKDDECRKVSVCIRFVTEKLETEELFLGFQGTSETTADTLFQLFRIVLMRFSLPISKCRGQCYDGFASLANSVIQTGLQACVQELEPRALYTHCAAQVLNLVVQDVASGHNGCGDAASILEVVRELKTVITLTKDSPDRPAWFEEYQGEDTPSVRPLFRTQTTMDTALLQSISSNYSDLGEYLGELSFKEDDAGYKASCLLSPLEEFSTFFSLQLMLKTFSRMDTVNAELQDHPLQFHKAGQMVDTLREDIMSLREGFQPFWESTTAAANDLNLESPVVPKSSRRLKDEDAFQTPEEMYRQLYVDVIDTASASLNCRLSASVFKHMQDVEDFVVGKGDCKRIVQFYGNDFDEVSLTLHRDMCVDMATRKGVGLSTFHDVVEFLKGDQGDYFRSTLPEITKLVKQVLTVPVTVTSCSSERSISGLERLGEHLQSLARMGLERPNHHALLRCHCDVTTELDLDVVANKFINRTAARRNTYLIKKM